MPNNNCSVYFPDYNFIVVPTAGCWARPDYNEIINRCIITKAIVALDGSEPISSLGGLSGVVKEASQGNENCQTLLADTLTKLVNCILANNGVTQEAPTCAYIVNSSTQEILAHSAAVGLPFDFKLKTFVVADIENNPITTTRFEGALADPNSYFEFANLDILDSNGNSYAYRSVYKVSEFFRLVVHVRLSLNLTYVPICKLNTETEDCNVCEDSSSSNEDTQECSNVWQPL